MEFFYNIETYAKILIGLVGAIVAFGKLRESFASIRRKQELKLDLEIYEKLKSNDGFTSSDLEDIIKSRLIKTFEKSSDNLYNFFVGIAVFIGFGFWTFDIFKSSDKFNAWMILTLFCSFAGLGMIFEDDKSTDDKNVFYKIGFYDKANFRAGILGSIIFGILTPIMIWRLDSFSYWKFLSGLVFIISIGVLIKNIKRIN